MKTKFMGALILLSGMALLYTSCKKDAAKQNTTQNQSTAASPDVISQQVAANLAKSLAGTYGGVNLSNGLSAPSVIQSDFGHQGGSTPNPLCGFTVDTVLHYTTNVGDTIKSTSNGRIIFYFNCFNGQPAGFLASDSLKTVGTAPGYSFLFDITQYYVIKSLNSANSLLLVNGALKSFVDLTYSKTGIKPTTDHTTYVMLGLTVDLSKNNDVTSGIATFISTGSNNYGPWTYVGTIKYLGNHKADVTINGKVYHITF
ncbi:hypothetical protein [Mucilaginibacter sp.]|uniref:hypothetical protein n=1 Tax=Mucilaginibacter sp. TaxID=1882438 RepID=UPI0028467232|nr:hypothetical protein [Mucilaginibacter sp.]MDR3694347.1 hypothetical protein [Mucilaginibacter sp.]